MCYTVYKMLAVSRQLCYLRVGRDPTSSLFDGWPSNAESIQQQQSLGESVIFVDLLLYLYCAKNFFFLILL